MVLEVHAALEAALQEADTANARLHEPAVHDRLVRVMLNLLEPTAAQRKGNFALVAAWDFLVTCSNFSILLPHRCGPS